MDEKIYEITKHFPFEGTLCECNYLDVGLINSTYLLTFKSGNNHKKYILQKINTSVFTKPEELMSNIFGITEFLKVKIAENGGDPERETLSFIKTNDGKNYYIDEDGACWRSYHYIDYTFTIDTDVSPLQLNKAAFAFGRFQSLLGEYNIEKLYDTIPDFHNTPKRLSALENSVAEDIKARKSSVKNEIEFAFERKKFAGLLTEKIKDGTLPLRVTHNDTKINNVLFDESNGEALCVIDLDTVMSGLSLYDFGDSIRSCASKAGENEADLSKVNIDLDAYEKYTEGFLKGAGKALMPEEIKLLPIGVKMMAFECGTRFLTDYLNGDTYFKTAYDTHNLVRCKNQFKLVKSIEDNMDNLNEITDNVKRRLHLDENK